MASTVATADIVSPVIVLLTCADAVPAASANTAPSAQIVTFLIESPFPLSLSVSVAARCALEPEPEGHGEVRRVGRVRLAPSLELLAPDVVIACFDVELRRTAERQAAAEVDAEVRRGAIAD